MVNHEGGRTERPVVLIADDDPVIRTFLNAALVSQGFSLIQANDGLSALSEFTHAHPDIVLLDMLMPGKDGLAVCSAIRKLPGGSNVPIIIMTGLDDIESIDRANEAGATDFITKPIQWTILRHRIQYLLRTSCLLEELWRSRVRTKRAEYIAKIGNWEWNILTGELIWSDEVFRQYGLDPVKDKPSYDLFLSCMSPDSKEWFMAALDRALTERVPFEGVYRMTGTDGKERYIHTIGEVVRDHSERPVSMFGIAQDITERKLAEEKLRQSERRYRILHETLRDAFVQVTMKGRITEFNDIFCQMLGYTPEEIRTLTYLQITPECWHEAEAEIVREQIIQRGYSDIYEKEYRRKDGTIFPVELRTVLSRDERGQPDAMWAIVHDITERKRTEEELHRYAVELERAYKDLESFTFVVSHDLKAPLTRIKGFSDNLLLDYSETLEADARHLLIRISANAGDMKALIEGLLNYSRLGSQEVNHYEVDVSVLIQNSYDELKPAEGDREVKLTIGEMPAAVGDPFLLKQVALNLISNALKFTRGKKKAKIEVGCTPGEIENVYFVRDNGIGFDMRFYEKLFGLFQRIHIEEEFEGTGAGLVIVKRIIEKHGGRVWAEGKPGKGATFYFTLPALSQKST